MPFNEETTYQNESTSEVWSAFLERRGKLPLFPWAFRLYPLALIELLARASHRDHLKDALTRMHVAPQTEEYLYKIFKETEGTPLAALLSDVTEDGLESFLRSDPSFFGRSIGSEGTDFLTPGCISELGLRVLDAANADRIADLCCGPGGFLGLAAQKHPDLPLAGLDHDDEMACIARLRLDFMHLRTHVEKADLFSANDTECFDRIFAHFPLGQRMRDIETDGALIQKILRDEMPYKRPRSTDWAYCQAIIDRLAEDGRAFVIVSPTALYSDIDSSARRYFALNGLIEAIIALPRGLLFGTSIPSNAVILSRHNTRIRFVDAQDLGVSTRTSSWLTSEDIEQVMDRLRTNSAKSVEVPISEVNLSTFNLEPERYLWTKIPIEHGRPLGDVSTFIGRGRSIAPSDLAEIDDKSAGGPFYLSVTDLSDDQTIEPSKRIVADAKIPERFLLRDGDIIIGRMAVEGGNFKVATVTNAPTVEIVPSHNLYVVRLDKTKAIPTFIAGFLNSSIGQELLRRATTGAAVKSLTTDNLKELVVPILAFERQDEIANEYRTQLDEIAALEKKLEAIRARAAEIFERNMA